MNVAANNDAMGEERGALLAVLAKKYLWWESPQAAVNAPYRVLAAAMNLGTIEDYWAMHRLFGESVLAEVVARAVAGWFSPKAWSFWHRVLGLVAATDRVPPLPERRVS